MPLFEPRQLASKAERLDDPAVYHYAATKVDVSTAVNVALATRRPLLVRGPPGCGKTLLAHNVARQLGVPLHDEVITSRTEATELQWRYDAIARLRDAQAREDVSDVGLYVTPGVLWKAFGPDTAGLYPKRRGSKETPPAEPPRASAPAPCVVLLDEIDKAEPEVPDALLDTLGRRRFHVRELDLPVECPEDRVPLIVITTNDERPLSRAFMRRCVVLELEHPELDGLLHIARLHFGRDLPMAKPIADKVLALRLTFRDRPSTAEYLDALRAADRMEIEGEEDPRWRWVEELVLAKGAKG